MSLFNTKYNKTKKKYNVYDLSGKYGIGYSTNTNEKFYFDLEEFDKIKDYRWYVNSRGYLISYIDEFNKKHIYLQRLIMDAPDGMDVDHIIHKPLDNRKENLRLATKSQNSMNTGLTIKNKSGVTGVFYKKENNKWQAQIGYNRKKIYLGYFENFDDAVLARREAEEKYFGEFSYDNSIKKVEVI